MSEQTDYSEYVNWDKVPKGITHVRFETMIEKGDYFVCHGIVVVPRPAEYKRIAIIAGNHNEYLNFIELINNPLKHGECFYIGKIEQLLGLRDIKVFFYGTCRERKDYVKIYEYVIAHNIEVVATI